ncbi:hypothetical protein ACFL2D_00195 [Patescibacteria group bacterium]
MSNTTSGSVATMDWPSMIMQMAVKGDIMSHIKGDWPYDEIVITDSHEIESPNITILGVNFVENHEEYTDTAYRLYAFFHDTQTFVELDDSESDFYSISAKLDPDGFTVSYATEQEVELPPEDCFTDDLAYEAEAYGYATMMDRVDLEKRFSFTGERLPKIATPEPVDTGVDWDSLAKKAMANLYRHHYTHGDEVREVIPNKVAIVTAGAVLHHSEDGSSAIFAIYPERRRVILIDQSDSYLSLQDVSLVGNEIHVTWKSAKRVFVDDPNDPDWEIGWHNEPVEHKKTLSV